LILFVQITWLKEYQISVEFIALLKKNCRATDIFKYKSTTKQQQQNTTTKKSIVNTNKKNRASRL